MPNLPPTDVRLGAPGSRYALSTPALVLDLDALERNIAAMATAMRACGRRLRPHVKSHKSVRIARMQIEAGAAGICCATLDEAEVMAAGGLRGILITSPVTTAIKIARLLRLLGRAPDTMIVVDDPGNASALDAAARQAGIVVPVLVDLELGFGRTGVPSADDAETLARHVAGCDALGLKGLQAYGGQLQHTAAHAERLARCRRAHGFIGEVVERLASIGMRPEIVTGGGTGTHAIDGAEGPFTEIQAGSYVFMDAEYRDIEYGNASDWPFGDALFVQAAVISANVAGSVTTDAGTKSFALNGPKPRIVAPGLAGATYEYSGDEHGRVRLGPDMPCPKPGSRVECVVPHCDPTVVLYDAFHVVRGDALVDVWQVDARGRAGSADPKRRPT
ncbi:MAG: DSD1 family PLP-dependent enzyme [Rhizobiaceae bacterium]